MRITHAIAAAALAAGLAAGAPAAQAAPVAASAAHSSHTVGSHAAKHAKDKTKTTASAPAQVKAGDDIQITATLTHKAGSKYKPYAKKKLELVLLDAPQASTGKVIGQKKTDKHGQVIFVLGTEAELAGQSFDFLVAYEGGSKAKSSESDVFTVAVTA